MNKLTLRYEEETKVITIDDFIELLNKKYNKEYINQEFVKITYENKQSFRNVLSIYGNVEEICFHNPNTNVEYLITLKNNNKYSVLEGEKLEYQLVIIFKTLPENSNLVIVDSIQLFNEKLNYFKIKSERKINFNLDGFIIDDEKFSKHIEKVILLKPNKVINLTDKEYEQKIGENNLIKIKILDEDKNLSEIDSNFNSENKIKIMDSDLIYINVYVLLKTNKHNLFILNSKNKKQL